MSKPLRPYSSPKEFANAMTLLQNELDAAHLTYGLYLELDTLRKEYKSLYRRTWGFWLQLQHSLLNDTILTLSRLYDDDVRTSSLRTMLKRLLLDSRNDATIIRKDEKLVERKKEPVVERLKRMREELLAHTNYNRAAGNTRIEEKYLLLVKDVPILIDRAMEIYSRHSGNLVSRAINQHYIPQREATFIFETLQEKLEHNLQKQRAYLEERGVNPDVFLDDERIQAEMRRLHDL